MRYACAVERRVWWVAMVAWFAAAALLVVGLASPLREIRRPYHDASFDFSGEENTEIALDAACALAASEIIVAGACLLAMLAGRPRNYVPRVGALFGLVIALAGPPFIIVYARLASTSDGTITTRYGLWVICAGFIACAAPAAWLRQIAAARARRSQDDLASVNRAQLVAEGGIVPDAAAVVLDEAPEL